MEYRTPEQCRSHHQKYEKAANFEYKKILEIVHEKLEQDKIQESTKDDESNSSNIAIRSSKT